MTLIYDVCIQLCEIILIYHIIVASYISTCGDFSEEVYFISVHLEQTFFFIHESYTSEERFFHINYERSFYD